MRKTIGRYQILSEIGRGAMGIVYKAHDPRIDRVVAIKTIRKDRYESGSSEANALHRFEREARAAGKLSHPGIVTVYDVDDDGDEVYITMEFVDGVSLGARLDDSTTIPAQQAIEIAIALCSALAYAHSHNVIHRDVKPDNILCLTDGTVKLADFGIARLETTTATHSAIGTPRYMAPEQWRGDPVDGRTDLFALGVLLFRLLTGTYPFTGRTHAELMYAVLNESPRSLASLKPGLPQGLDAVVNRALQRDPSQRYASAFSMGDALEDLASKQAEAEVRTDPLRLTILRRGDIHFVDFAETGTLIPRSETRVDAAFMDEITREVERVAAGSAFGRGVEPGETITEVYSAPIGGPPPPGSGAPALDRVSELQGIGRLIYSHLLTEPARQKIATYPRGSELYLRLDEQLIHVPWELCFDGEDFLATKFRVGRQVITEHSLPRRSATTVAPDGGPIDILIVSDPTCDLSGARDECAEIESQLSALTRVRVTRMIGAQARKMAVLQALSRCAVVHFAGHSVYDAEDPTRSGWMLNDGVLAAGEMTKLDRLPQLVFSNSCNAGATLGWDGRSKYEGHANGIGSAFLLAGVQNYIGTFWVTHDQESAHFAKAFYQVLLRGESVGEALAEARRRVIDGKGWNELTWASYMLYGDPSFRLPVRPEPITGRITIPEVESPASDEDTLTLRMPRRLPDVSKRAALGAAVVVGVVALAALWLWLSNDASSGSKPVVTATAQETPAEKPTPDVTVDLIMPRRYRVKIELLERSGISQASKLAQIDKITQDDSDWATQVLQQASLNPDVLVSMKAIRGLSGRGCGTTADHLIRLLSDADPKRRAWSAKILGDNGCVETLELLAGYGRSDPSELVRNNIATAIRKLAGGGR